MSPIHHGEPPVGIGEAAKLLERHPQTLRRWDKEGVLVARRSETGQRYYLASELASFVPPAPAVVRQAAA